MSKSEKKVFSGLVLLGIALLFLECAPQLRGRAFAGLTVLLGSLAA